MDDFPELSGHLAADAQIVANPIFERTVLKIAKGHPISDVERASVRCLLWKPAVGHEDDSLLLVDDNANGASEELTYAQKVELRMKRRKSCSNEIAAKYINLDVLCGTSVECERLFSIAKNILTDARKSTSPAVFQATLVLKVNRREWDVYTVGRAMGKSTGERFSVLGGGDGVCVGGEEAADDPDLFYEEDEECQLWQWNTTNLCKIDWVLFNVTVYGNVAASGAVLVQYILQLTAQFWKKQLLRVGKMEVLQLIYTVSWKLTDPYTSCM